MIETVEQEINKAMKRHPKRAEFIWNSFALFGNEAERFLSHDMGESCWRTHVREILDRIGNPPSRKEERDLGTLAEALIVFSECSLKAPLIEDATYAFAWLFQHVFGKDRLRQIWNNEGMPGGEIEFYESWKGARDELIGEVRRKLSRDYHFPTQEEVDARRAEDLEQGNSMPWTEYAPIPATQVGFGLQVETVEVEKEELERKPKEKPAYVQTSLF